MKGCEVNANGHAGAGRHVPLPEAKNEALAEWKPEGEKRFVSIKEFIIIF